jgi:uncharacterized protein involved in exopolysaccharide biosynthesis
MKTQETCTKDNEGLPSKMLNIRMSTWKTIVLSMVFTGSLGLIYGSLLKNVYQAVGTLEMASTQGGMDVDGSQLVLLEKPNNLVEKLKLPLFYSENSIKECQLINKNAPHEALSKQIKSFLVKNTTYVTVSFKADSPEIAKACLSSVVQDIQNDQAIILKPIKEYRQAQLDLLKSQLNQADKMLTQSTFFYSKSTLVKDIDKYSLQLETMRNARLLTAIYAPSDSINPTRIQILIISLLIGVILGVAFIKLKAILSKQA